MSCDFKITRSNLISKLQVASGRYNVPINNYIMFVYGKLDENAEPTKEFMQAVSNAIGIPVDKINAQYIDLVVKYITDTYNRDIAKDVNYSADKENSYTEIAMYGYNSVYAREFAKRYSLALVLDAKREIEDKYGSIEKYAEKIKENTGKTLNKLQLYTEFLRNKLVNRIVDRVVQRGIATEEEIRELIKNNDTARIEELFGTEHVEDLNLLATYKEFKANKEKFIDEVFINDGKLRKLIYEKKEDKETKVQEDIENQYEPESSHESSEEKDFVDNYIGNLTNKLGDVGHYMSNIDGNIILYFSTINKLTSVNKNTDGTYQYDTNNPLGVADTMDAVQCINTIFSHANATNVSSLISEIRRIAKEIPDMAGLVQVADYMKEHPDFAFALWRNFAKTIISKLETSNVNGNGFVARQSNFSVNKESVLKFDFINAFKITSITANKTKIAENVNSINKIVDTIKSKLNSLKLFNKQEDIDRINKEIDDLIESAIPHLTNSFKAYFNTIQEQAINCYIDQNDNKLNAINFLLNTINSLTTIANNTEANYNTLQDQIRQVSDRIYELETRIRENNETLAQAAMYPGSGIDTRGLNKQNREDREEIEKLKDKRTLLSQQDFIDGNFMGKIAPFTREIARYSYVKTDLNSRNVHGNLSSDLITNSMITNIINTLKNPNALVNFGKYKQQSRQYDFSPIMIEHKEDGGITNYGLFRQDPVSKELTPTPYANRLLQEYLYSGIADVETSDGALYAEMSRGDYTASAIYNFFYHETEYNDEGEINDGGPASFANYFMRIPSDAPKNFVIRAPKYSIRTHGQQQGLIVNGEINVNHPIFRQFRNAFVQEMQDAANAIQVIFDENDIIDGAIDIRVADKKIDTRQLYENYHYKGELITRDKNGKLVLTGNVFHSDRFVLTEVDDVNHETKTTNYGELIINEAFDFFYGGANSIKAKRTVNGVEIIISPEQEAVINKYLTEFIKKYSDQCFEKANKYKHLYGNNTFDKTDITEFALNYHLAYIGFNDLFEGDTKFYKSSQDALKRFKEIQGSGIIYALLNYNDELWADSSPVENSRLNDTTFTSKTYDAEGNVIETPIKITQYNRFKAVTINNTVRTGDSIGTFKLGKKGKPARFIKNENGELVESDKGNYIFDKRGSLANKLIDALKATGMSNKNAINHAANTMAGYYGTTVNDAQSYITFEEWVRRISARGQLEEYQPLIDAILDETKPLDAKTIKKFIQVQKNFYYDQHFNAKLRVFAPRQIKNAEFVLVPRLIKGTQLEEVYNLLKEAGIDQLNTKETSKAGKCNVLTLWDNNGEITEENKKDFITNAKGATELFNYNYLYTQQETPSHLNASNKAGIQFMKKIIDNIDKEINGKPNPLYPLKEKFQRLYTENIISSAEEFADEIGISIDENGNFVLNDESDLDVQLFYDLLKEEISRQGLDSNSLDYVTLNDDGIPVMPTFMGNFHKKLESIVQSMINNRITRQTLPGFHAAQITNIGFKPLSDRVDNVSYNRELRYHPDGEPYIEIMLPKSNFNFKRTKEDGTPKSDEELLEELREEGLDTIIGYRIPTEGKQSICVMKVVGFIDDAYDSTIVVPDDWVSQTGSDFDIDSIYGINYMTEINKEGKIIKATPKTVGPRDYIRYIKKKLKNQLKKEGIDTKIAAEIQKFVEDYNTDAQDKFDELQSAANEIYSTMKHKYQSIINTYNKISVDGKTRKEKYITKLKYVISSLNKELKTNDELDKKDKNALKVYNNALKEVYKYLSTQNDDFLDKKEEAVSEAYQNLVDKLSEQAVKVGLPSYDKFAERKNRAANRNVRNNEILETAINILQHEFSLEENLSRSNFEKVIEGRDAVQPEYIKEARAARSPYNFFDQAAYHEDAMSGIKLKGASVARDTFVSVCNTVHPYINPNNTIKVVYKKEDGFTKAKLSKIFDIIETDKDGNFVVTHNTIGWTKNNKNAADLLLTPYTSQTTAHILDSIKEGAIPNVNSYTFNVYKTFPDIGCDYYLAVAFMAQPAVSRIVELNNNNNSVYAESSDSSPVKTTIVEIANKLMAHTDTKFNTFSKTSDIVKAVSETYRAMLDYKLNDHTLSFDKLNKRLGEPENTNTLLFDLKVALDFQHLRSLSNKIGDISRVLNPDKFGAKQTVFETIDTVNKIESLRRDNEIIYVQRENGQKVSIIESVYPSAPGVKSTYPTLNAFYKYSTQLSVQLAKLIFDTHTAKFDNFLLSISNFINHEMNDETYHSFRNYVLNYIYTHTSAIKYNYKINDNGTIELDENSDRRQELGRIYGLGKGVNLLVKDDKGVIKSFDVEDINYPTKEELRQFTTLSPAQKVHFIRSKFNKKGVFDFIIPELAGRGKNKNKQTLTYTENAVDIETIYNEFEKAFFNSNSLIKLAAIDVVKYAYAVEGFKMKKGAVNKMIKNTVLYLSKEEGGLGITEESAELLSGITDINNINIMDELRVNFIRSHATAKHVTTKKIRSHKTGQFYDAEHKKPIWEKDLIPNSKGIIYITNNDYLEKYSLGTVSGQNFMLHRFVILVNDNNVSTLYRIREAANTVILTPLNTLEENEFNYMSINNDNNNYESEGWYDAVIHEFDKRMMAQYDEVNKMFNEDIIDQNDIDKELDKVNANARATFSDSIASLIVQADLHKYMTATADNSRYAKPFDINSKDTPYTSGFETVVDAVKERFDIEGEKLLIIRSKTLANFIRFKGPLYGSHQEINGSKYLIQKGDYWKQNKKYIEEKNEVKEPNKDLQEIFTQAQREGRPVNDAFVITKEQEYYSSTSEISLPTSVPEENGMEYYSSTGELNTIPTVKSFNLKSIQTMYYRRKSLGDKRAAASIDYINSKGLDLSPDEIDKYLPIITQINAEYIVNSVKDIIDRLNNFEINGKTYKIDDDTVINAIKQDKELRNKYLATILDARAFVNTYSIIDQIDINSADPETNKFLKEIKDAINNLRSSSVISNAEIRMGNDVLAKLSDNPLMQNDVLGVFDGYHTASLFDAWINDLQETSNPLIQIVSKQVMTDINKQEMLAKQAALKFKNAIKDIKLRASRAGVNIDWDHIFDEDGKFIQKYNQAFLDKLEELRDKKTKAKLNIDKDPKAYYEATLEFEKWKAENLNQEVNEAYYNAKNALDEDMLTHHSEIYIKYKTLMDQRAELYSHVTGGTLAQNYVDELEAIEKEIESLTSEFIFDGDSISPKYSFADPNNPYTGENRAIYSVESAFALNEYKKRISELNNKYYKFESKKGFDKELENNLAIISEREKRDANGHLLTPTSELMNDPTYVKAKSWLANNTYFINTSDKFTKLQQAFEILKESKTRTKNLNPKLVSGLAKKHKAYDEFGIVDARLFSDAEIAQIKEQQELEYGIKEQNLFSDRTLITNAPSDDTIFSQDFYNHMRSNGANNPAYLAKVREINDILRDHYNPGSKIVHTSELSINELVRLNTLYEELDNIKKHIEGTSTNGKAVHDFIEQNVEFVYDQAKYDEEENRAKLRNQKEDGYYAKWLLANSEIKEDKDGKSQLVPNHFLYGYAVPKGYKQGQDHHYVDKAKTEALRYIRENSENVATEYYHEKYREMRNKGEAEFTTWFNANHVYNPYTHSMEPVRCWTRLKVLGEDNNTDNYFPKYNYKDRKPQDGKDANGNQLYDDDGNAIPDMRNPNFKPDLGYSQNYNGRNANYNNTTPQNEYEKEISKLIKDIVEKYAITTQAKSFFGKGYAPIQQKQEPETDTTKKVGKELVKFLGWINNATGKEDWLDDNEIDYSKDTTINMPMSTLLKSKDSVDIKYNPPKRKKGETNDEYNKRYEEWYNAKNEAQKTNREIHRNLIDRNWEGVIENFIIKASKFNAIQNNKYLLFYAKNMIDNQQTYVKNLGFNRLQKTGNRDINGSIEYAHRTDENLKGQYINWIRRLVYDQYKKPNNKFTRVANSLQSFTSAKYMMLNVSGGVANITQGWTQVLGERFARDYFGSTNWWKGVGMWNHNIGSFIYDMYKDNSSSVANAIIKFFGVVDQESINGAPIIPDASTYIKRARDIMFSPLGIGEHFLQNSALFAMLYSHRIYFDAEASKDGKPRYTYKSEGQVRNEAMDLAFREFIKGTRFEEMYDNFVKYETSKPDFKKEYVWFRKDFTTEFANIYFNRKEIKRFNEIKKQKEKEIAKEFNNDSEHPTLMSQLDIDKDGYLKFKNGSFLLTKMSEDEAMELLAGFKGRVVSVNKKIHGVYTKLGAAQIENKWAGSLLMQYHKHIYPGLLKRWRRQGYFNEERGTVEKGTNVALLDFIALPLHKASFAKRIKADTNVTDENLKTIEGIQNICKSYIEFVTHFTLYFNLLPRHEQGNILRGLADFAGLGAALCTAVGVQCLGADDDKHGMIYDFMINQADRLATESMALRSFGLVGEFKKMWSSPLAAQNLITDIGKSLSLVAKYIIQGEDFEAEYTTGAYKGENKFTVLLKRNMPMYHSIYMLERLSKNNKYYKLDQNMLSIIPTKPIADWISGK